MSEPRYRLLPLSRSSQKSGNCLRAGPSSGLVGCPYLSQANFFVLAYCACQCDLSEDLGGPRDLDFVAQQCPLCEEVFGRQG